MTHDGNQSTNQSYLEAESAMNQRGLSFGDDREDKDRSLKENTDTVNVQPVDGRLKILFLAANPDNSTRLKLDEEFRSIQNCIRGAALRDRIELDIRQAVRHGDLALALLECKPHVVHFSGHGNDCDELILQDDQGNSDPVSRDAIVALFKTLKDNIRLVVFNACFSEPQAQGIVENIAFAIGMNQAIGDKAAIQFAESLYQGIGFGRTLQEAFDLGKVALQLGGIAENLTPHLLYHPKADPSDARLIKMMGGQNIQGFSAASPDDALQPRLPSAAGKEQNERVEYVKPKSHGWKRFALPLIAFVTALFVYGGLSFLPESAHYQGNDTNDVGAYFRAQSDSNSKYYEFCEERVLPLEVGQNVRIYLVVGDVLDFVHEYDAGKNATADNERKWSTDALVMSTNENLNFSADNPTVQHYFRGTLEREMSVDRGAEIQADIKATFAEAIKKYGGKFPHVTTCLASPAWEGVSPRQVCFLSTDRENGGTYYDFRWLEYQLDEINLAEGIKECLNAATVGHAKSIVIPFVGSSKIHPNSTLASKEERFAHIKRRQLSLQGIMRGVRQYLKGVTNTGTPIEKIAVVIWKPDIETIEKTDPAGVPLMKETLVATFKRFGDPTQELPPSSELNPAELLLPETILISGEVTEGQPARPVPAAWVTVYERDNETGKLTNSPICRVGADADGRYEVKIANPEWKLRSFELQFFFSQGSKFIDAQQAVVTRGTETVNAHLRSFAGRRGI